MVEICVMVLNVARLLLHDELDSVVLERRDTGHRDSGVARKQFDVTKFWSGRNVRDATPCIPANLTSTRRPPNTEMKGLRVHQRPRLDQVCDGTSLQLWIANGTRIKKRQRPPCGSQVAVFELLPSAGSTNDATMAAAVWAVKDSAEGTPFAVAG